MTFRTWALGAIGYAVSWLALAGLLAPAYGQATLVPNAIQQFFDSNGNPISSGTVGFYQPGTTNPKTTWQDSGQSIPYGNPIVLNQAGEPNNAAGIWGTGSYRQIVQDANGSIIWDALTSTSASTAPGTAGDGLPLGFIMPYAGSVAPAGYDFAYGQAYSRSTFPLLLAAVTITESGSCINGSANVTGLTDTSQMGVGQPIESGCFPSNTTVNAIISPTSIQASTTATGVTGTYSFQIFPFGNGNGSTTFNLPDLRGYVPAGRDNMGGTPASRLTAASKVGGWDYTGAAGGLDALTLSTSQLPAHTHDVVINDPGHQHVFTFANSENNPGGGVAGVVSNITQSSSATAAVITNTADTLATATAASAGGGVATGAALGTMPTSFTVNGAQLQFGGTNYTNGAQTLTVLGGTCSTQPQLATTISGNVVTSINSVATPGACSVAPPQITTLSDGSHTNAVARIALGNGSGYTTGAQVLTVVGGTCSVPPQINVTVAGGSVAAVASIAVAGSCTSPPANPVATSGGGGTGAVLDIVYSTAATAIVQPTVTLNYIIKVSANSGGFTIPIANDTVLGNFSGMSAPPVATSPGVVFNFVCGTRGALYEVGVGGAGCLGPGTAGNVLTSNGAGADPSYQPAPGSGSGPITGPGVSILNDLVCWANASGTRVNDCGLNVTAIPATTNPNTWTALQTFNAGIVVSGAPTSVGPCTVPPALDVNTVYATTCLQSSNNSNTSFPSQMGMTINFTSNPNAAGTAEAVGLFVGTTVTSGAPNSWAVAFGALTQSGAVGNTTTQEIDAINGNCDYGPLYSPIGGCSTITVGTIYDGISAGQHPNASAIWIETDSTLLWHTGVIASGNSIKDAFLADLTSSHDVLLAQGAHTNGINLAGGTYSGFAWESPSATIDGSGNGLLASLGLGSPLGVSSGGTGRATLTAHGVLLGNGTSAVTQLAPGTTNYSLVSNGGGADPSYQQISLTAGVTGLLPNANLANPATTVNGQTCTLGSSCTVTAIPSGSAGGDLSGTYPNPTVAKVNAVAYPASPSTNTVPVVTGSNTVTYEALPNAALATMTTNTVKGNATSGSATPTDLAVPSCSTAGSALNWTTSGGASALSCNTAINAAQLGGATFASPGAIGGSTPAAITGTTIGANTGFALSGNTVLTFAASTYTELADTTGNNSQLFLGNATNPTVLIRSSSIVWGAVGGSTAYGDYAATTPGTWTFVQPLTINSATFKVTTLANSATTSAVCYAPATGLFTYDGTIGTCTVSDETFKVFDGPVDNALERLVAMSHSDKFGYFHANDAGRAQFGDSRRIGLGAQTLGSFFPELAERGSDGLYSADYAKLTVPIIAGLATLGDRMDVLQADNDNLRAKIESLEAGLRSFARPKWRFGR